MIRHVRWLLKAALGLLLLLWLPKQSQAQTKNDYKTEWNEIQELENNGQTKTALEKTQVLYEKILKDDQNPLRDGHLVKVLIYYNKYQASLEEDGLVKAIARFDKTSKFKSAKILNSKVAKKIANQ